MPDPTLLGPAMTTVGQGVGAFSSFLPNLSDVRKASPSDSDVAGDVRHGEVCAVALTVLVGAVTSYMTGSPVPVTVGLVVAVGLVVIYETTLRAERPGDPA